MNKADLYPGVCFSCLQETEVRQHDNLYTVGSEGTKLCRQCENEVLFLLRENRRIASNKKMDDWKKRKNSK
ncbi:MAG: hypothetical protein ACTSPB_04770 [Candidatus Thorarchaeota archaeon]